MGPTQPTVSTFGRLGIACCAVILAISMGLGLAARQTPLVTAAIVISKTDPTKAPPRGTAETVLHYAQSRDSTRFAETRAYIYEVYRLAPLVGIDPAFVISQSALETADWTSFYWTNHLNPAGIGITQTGVPSYTWSTGTEAARFHLARLYVYVAGPIDVGNPLYPYRLDGPDYSHLFSLGYDGQAQIIDDLTGKWAVDPIYGQKIANRGNAIYGSGTNDPLLPTMPVSAIDASAGNDPWRTRDGNIKSSFAVEGIDTPPPGAYITFDMGRRIVLERVQWMFRQSGAADSFDVQRSNDAITWTTVSTYSNPTINVWTIASNPGTARYIRFLFRNPNGDLSLGFLSEVEFYGVNASGVPTATATPYPSPSSTNTPLPTATQTSTPGPPTPTRTPSALPGVSIPIVGSGGSGSAAPSKLIWDGSITTTWQTTTSSPPSQTQVYVDLGDTGTITGVEFMVRRLNAARQYQIRVSNDKVAWTTVATFDYASPLMWQRARFTTSGRYIQFLFTNPTGTSALGYLAEVKVFGSLGTFQPAIDPTVTPAHTSTATPTSFPTTAVDVPTSTPTATPTLATVIDLPRPESTPTQSVVASPIAESNAIQILQFRRTTNASNAGVLTDRDTTTTWRSIEPMTGSSYVIAELGQVQHIGTIELAAGPDGIRGQVAVEYTINGVEWIPVSGPIDLSPAATSLLTVNSPAIEIRIVVTNLDSLDWIGGISELRLYP